MLIFPRVLITSAWFAIWLIIISSITVQRGVRGIYGEERQCGCSYTRIGIEVRSEKPVYLYDEHVIFLIMLRNDSDEGLSIVVQPNVFTLWIEGEGHVSPLRGLPILTPYELRIAPHSTEVRNFGVRTSIFQGLTPRSGSYEVHVALPNGCAASASFEVIVE